MHFFRDISVASFLLLQNWHTVRPVHRRFVAPAKSTYRTSCT